MKIFKTSIISEIDNYTIENEPISSINLMERAASQLSKYIINKFDKTTKFCIVAGTGNNGGDGLALARILHFNGYMVRVYLVGDITKQSNDNKINWGKLLKKEIFRKHITKHDELEIYEDEIIIDALFGSGLNRPLEGEIESIIKKINNSGNYIISIDVPSGLMGEDNRENNNNAIIKANLTLTLEFPKLSFFFPENNTFVGDFVIVPIFLHPKAKEEKITNWFYTDKSEVSKIIKKRHKFIEKRELGHALIIGGNEGKVGAAILASKACVKSGTGLTSVCLLSGSSSMLTISSPEVMTENLSNLLDKNNPEITKYTAIGIGPGLGTSYDVLPVLEEVLIKFKDIPLVIDADGLNLIAKNKYLISIIPENTILTPHFREFDRLFDIHNSHYDRFLTATKMAQELKLIIILKGAHTQIHLPDGRIYFNSTGNPGMATGGMGDVLTGIITSLLAQGYSPQEASILGVFVHGLAADYALLNETYETLTPSDVIHFLPHAFKDIHNERN
ncbi:MAG: NAD(P)H-hydrate dehydratase [Bacteroidales bacterium]|nr:NAD(P)H-hydrate dehydratase [Bacteroidales bacterium]